MRLVGTDAGIITLEALLQVQTPRRLRAGKTERIGVVTVVGKDTDATALEAASDPLPDASLPARRNGRSLAPVALVPSADARLVSDAEGTK